MREHLNPSHSDAGDFPPKLSSPFSWACAEAMTLVNVTWGRATSGNVVVGYGTWASFSEIP